MAKEFDNSLERFARPAAAVGFYVAAAAAVILLVGVIVAGIVSQNWIVGSIAALAVVAVAALVLAASRRQRIAAGQNAAAWDSMGVGGTGVAATDVERRGRRDLTDLEGAA